MVAMFPSADAIAASSRLFEWEMPTHFGEARDAAGRLRETDPSNVRPGPWHVRLQVADELCDPGVRLTWTVPKGHVDTSAPCAYVATFRREGSYGVTLTARRGSQTQTDTQTLLVEDRLIVSLGDSVASGEALPDIPGLDQALWQSERCHRSARAGTALAAAQVERDDAHSSVTFVHLACSGAEIRAGLLGGYAGVVPPLSEPDLPAQVDELNQIARTRRVPDAVLISVGANDLGFGPIVAFCAHTPDCFSHPFGGKPTVFDHLKAKLAQLPKDYDALDAAISKKVPRNRIAIVDYFDPTRDSAGQTCASILGGVTRIELEQAQTQVLAPLNRAVAAAAGRHGWRVIGGNATRFRDHGYCATRQSWITNLSRSVVDLGGRIDGRLKGTLHPDATGQEVIGGAIAAQLETQFFPGQVFVQSQTRTVVKDRTLSLLGIAAIFLAALALVSAVGFASRRAAFFERRAGGVVLVLAGVGCVVAAIVLRDALLLGSGLAALAGATFAFGVITFVRAT
jgi:lysophospholipase L1-like esterase